MKFLPTIQNFKKAGRKGFAVLVDPDKLNPEKCAALMSRIKPAHPDFIFIGGSLMTRDNLSSIVSIIKEMSDIPVIIFPGNPTQIEKKADGILFLSLISGRNPDFLIGSHVIAAPLLKDSGLEIIPTGYLLIESGIVTTANYMSGTLPIPAEKPEIAACTALAGQYLGLQVIYMDGGSGAQKTISSEMINLVAKTVDIPLIIGGGIRSVENAKRIFQAGADLIVVGNAAENPENGDFLLQISTLASSFSKNVSV